jgi:GNAT superfamily N-acetyltransferase
MPRIDVVVSTPVHESFRVAQVRGMFDLPECNTCHETFSVEVPDAGEKWQIGAIVGPSASGKTTVARAAFPGCLAEPRLWPANRAVVDCLGERPIKEITRTLVAVGLGSPPAWLKPYHALSTGEKFRCDLARALLSGGPGGLLKKGDRHLAGCRTRGGSPSGSEPVPVFQQAANVVVCDEFTSVVDRTVARLASAAVSKAIRSGKIASRLVAVTCHDDVLEWLEPDWVLDTGRRELLRGRLRRPPIRLRLVRCRRAAWRPFARHHYLTSELPRGATCHLGLIDEQPAAFCAWLPMFGRRGVWRIARLVVLPDYQGVGIGGAVLRACCEMVVAAGRRAAITTSHPAMIAHLRSSPDWRLGAVKLAGGNRSGIPAARYRSSAGRAVVSAEWVSEVPVLGPG